ncbi:MAG: UPF0182 family protein [Candidatus Aenigmatarchaeota archaeon]
MIKEWIAAIIIIILAAIPIVFGIYGDWVWFQSVGYDAVFVDILFTSIYLGLAFGLSFLAFSLINIKVASKRSGKKKKSDIMVIILSLVFTLIVVSAFANWDIYLKSTEGSVFGETDPVFGMDIGFYVFTLPWYNLLFSFALFTIIITMILTTITYLYHSQTKKIIDDDLPAVTTLNLSAMKTNLIPHLSVLLGLLFFTLTIGFMLAQYGLLFSTNGAAFGAGYIDLNIMLPLLMVLGIISFVIGLLFLANVKIKRWKLLVEGLAIFVGIAIVGLLVAGVVQGFQVGPDEYNFEEPYIVRSIEHTLAAYGIDNVEQKPFPVGDLALEDIENNRETIDNIRLWDFRPLGQTYEQLQLFRTYYEFNDIDIDRYTIDGEPRQVMISAREINIRDLPSNARTWVNEHMVYTHGYGVVANDVNKVSDEGLPEFLIKNIPPETETELALTQPEIYYGELEGEYAIINTNTQELDYPSGDQNVYTSYEGKGGVIMDSLNRLVYAIKFASIELLFSNSITDQSKILMNRNIIERVDKIAPFLLYDSDPYIVAADGKLYWMLDAYSVSDAYPYSQPSWTGRHYLNYIRNSVKVVVDAYNGDVTYYVIDKDPVISTYMNMFPELFVDFEQMPDTLKDHIRYPEGLFILQKEMYSTFHMEDPRVFYNKEDVWITPFEILRGSKSEMMPYYVIMKLPGDVEEEFILMIPFTPRGKDNMIGWMAAKSDLPDYGKLVVFTFSKQELVYGPLQIEARIDQDTDISQKITLWSQAGSNVFRGNTLVIPIEDSILYVEPLFLQATEQGSVPQLKQVIVSHGNRVVMEATLQEALDAIFGKTTTKPGEEPTEPQTDEETINQIRELYKKAQEALRTGDLSLYADYVDQIGDLLK